MPIVEDEADDLPVDESAQEESQDQPEPDAEDIASTEPDAETEDEGGEVVISLGDPVQEPEQEKAPAWVRDLRKRNRELERRNRELEAQRTQPAAEVPQVGPKPKLEDFDYDPDKFQDAVEAWVVQKRAADDAKAKAEQADRQAREVYEAKRERYRSGLKALPVKDADEAHDAASIALDTTQQGIIVHAADDPAKLVYALAKNPTELERISKIKDPVLFAREIGRLETKVQTTTRKPATQPETKVKAGGTTISRNATLDKLRAEAERTGDYTEVRKFKQAQRATS